MSRLTSSARNAQAALSSLVQAAPGRPGAKLTKLVAGGGGAKKRRALWGGPSASAGRYRALLARSPPAETVEFSVSCASEKRMPFVRCKSENRAFGVPAVADTNPALG